MTYLWITVGLVAVLIATWAGALLLALAMGRMHLDLRFGRSLHQLGPITTTVHAPRELVFDIISAPYLGRSPGTAAGVEVLARSEELVVARHHTRVHFYTAETTEAVEFTAPSRVGFRHLTGPVPYATEEFTLEQTDDGTELVYRGEVGIDFYIFGRIAGRYWVCPQWERVVAAHIDDLKLRAETAAARSTMRQSGRTTGTSDG